MRVIRHPSATPTASELRLLSTLENLDSPGIVLSNHFVSHDGRVREVDALILTPTLLMTVEVKHTDQTGPVHVSLNSAWTVDGQPLTSSGGSNPMPQARVSAQVLKTTLRAHGVGSVYVTAAVVLDGDVDLPVTTVGDVMVASASNCVDLLTKARPTTISRETASQILSALDVNTDDVDLSACGFSDTPPVLVPTPNSPADPSKSRHRDQRLSAAQQRAHKLWSQSNRRRVALSAFIGLPALYWVTSLNPAGLIYGLVLTAAVIGVDLWRRRSAPGPVQQTAAAATGWAVCLVPALTLGTAVGNVVSMLSQVQSLVDMLALQVNLLCALGMLLVMSSGRSWFIYPSPVVMERHDRKGKPTGTFTVVDISPIRRGRVEVPEAGHRVLDDSWLPVDGQ